MARLVMLMGFMSMMFAVLFWLATWTNYFGGARLRRWFKNAAVGLGAITLASIGLVLLYTLDKLS